VSVIEKVARAIAADLGNQDWGEPFKLKDDLTLSYIDQGETDFASLARAALEALREHKLEVRDEGGVVHQLVGAPDDIWKTLLTAALNEPAS
jgi:hypothetical protein